MSTTLCLDLILKIFHRELPGKLRLTANLNSSVNVNDDNSFSRPPSSAQVGIDYNQRTSLGPLKFSNEYMVNIIHS